jgi:flagellar basal body rod protein FlgG
MNYGLYLSAGGALTNLYRQDVIANNLANVNTTGFKPDVVNEQARLPQRLEPGQMPVDPQTLLEKIGGGDWSGPTRINLRQGGLAESHGPLDLAVEGEGFFVVDAGKGQGDKALRFTRDGRMALNSNGTLVTASSGFPVLDDEDQPIMLDRSRPVNIDTDGTVRQGDEEVATLQIATVADTSKLTKVGDNLILFTIPGSNNARRPADGSVRQGMVESSADDPVLVLNEMINVSRAIQANALMMQYHDNILGQAINTFGRVA